MWQAGDKGVTTGLFLGVPDAMLLENIYFRAK